MSQKLYVYSVLAMMKETENFVPQERVWCILFITGKCKGKEKISKRRWCLRCCKLRRRRRKNQTIVFCGEGDPFM